MVGRLLALGLVKNYCLDIPFTKFFLKMLLSKTIYLNDLEDVDQDLYI